jgi:hypothetical protein
VSAEGPVQSPGPSGPRADGAARECRSPRWAPSGLHLGTRRAARRCTAAHPMPRLIGKTLAALRTLIDGEPASDAVHAVALDTLRTQLGAASFRRASPALVRESEAARTQVAR